MRTIIVLISVLSFMSSIKAQSKCDFAKMDVISDLKKLNGDNVSNLFETNDDLLVLMLNKGSKLILQQLNKDYIVTIEKEYELVGNGDKAIFLDAFGNKETLFIFSCTYDKKNMIVYKTEISLNDLSVSSSTKEFKNFPSKNREYFLNQDFKLISSPDKKYHLFMFADEESNKDSAIVETMMYDSNMELQWETKFNVLDYKFFLDWTLFADDYGNMHIIERKAFNSNPLPSPTEYNYFLTSYISGGDKIGPTELTLKEGHIYDYSFKCPKNNELIISGLCYSGTIVVADYQDVIYRTGSYCLTINTHNGEIVNSTQEQFNIEFNKEHTHLDYPKPEDYNNGILHYSTIETVLREDGGLYTIIEYSATYEDATKFLDMVIFSYNKNAEFEWSVSIPKHQRTIGGGTTTSYWKTYGSFYPLYFDETLFIIYNDNINNLNNSSAKVAKWKSEADRDNIVCVATISKSGELKKYILDRENAVAGPPRIGAAIKLSDNKSLYVNLRKGIFERHGIILFQ